MSQVLFPKLATSNAFQKIAKSLLKFAIGTFPKVFTNLFSKNCHKHCLNSGCENSWKQVKARSNDWITE